MIKDLNKGISEIAYNHLNLPTVVKYVDSEGNVQTLTYTYDATGTKLKKESTEGATVDYIGGIQYKNGALDFIQHAEGRAVKNGSSYAYEYNLTDHLGNVRATVDASGAVIQRDDYYPFGGRFNSYSQAPENKYLYNGKELQDETQWYDFGARMQDPWLGRFFAQDRFAEKYYGLSPYQYAANNPINVIDINGDSIWYTINEDVITMHVTGKVMNSSIDDIDMNESISDISDGLADAFSGELEYNGKTYQMTTDIQLEEASSMDDVKESDHLIVMADGTGKEGDARGTTNMDGGKVIHLYSGDYPTNAWYSPGWSNTRTSVHEFGHAAGLGVGHVKGEGNLMNQGGTGTNLTNSQRIQMLGRRGSINNGSNSYTSPLTKQKVPDPYIFGFNTKTGRYEKAHINSVGLSTK